VTAVAWFGIASAGCAAPIALVQSLMVGTLSEQVAAALDSQELSQMPAPVRYLFEHLGLLSWLFLLGSVATLACSIGLLKRKNWGRLGVITLLVVAILQQFVLFAVQLSLGSSGGLPGETPQEIRAVLVLMQVVGGVLTVVQLGVCGWLIWKLGTPAIRAEFGA
jgi:hypothetical protein